MDYIRGKSATIYNRRPTSATAKLQTHEIFDTPLLQNSSFVTTTEQINRYDSKARLTHSNVALISRDATSIDEFTVKSEAAVETSMIWRPRRLTVTGTDLTDVSETVKSIRRLKSASLMSRRREKIETKFTLEVLDGLKESFQLPSATGAGKLSYERFWRTMRTHLQLNTDQEIQVLELFQKIDCDSVGYISWEDFCTYMQLEYSEREQHDNHAHTVSVCVPARSARISHRDPILRIVDLVDGSFMSCARNGVISFWSPELKTKPSRCLPINEVSNHNSRNKWITDLVLMSQYSKLSVSTSDREIQFYELSTFEFYCQLHGFTSVPLCLDYSNMEENECILVFGDKDGCVNIIHLLAASDLLRLWKKSGSAGSPACVSTEEAVLDSRIRFFIWKVHTDWIQRVRYYADLRQVVSCCNHERNALVIVVILESKVISLLTVPGNPFGVTQVSHQRRHELQIKEEGKRARPLSVHLEPRYRDRMEESVFCVYKGVKCFEYSKHKNIIVTGGLDRIVRVWNPYMCNKPVALLKGHTTPITNIFIDNDDNRIFSLSADRCLRIWDSQDHHSLLVVRSKSHKISGEIQAAVYSRLSKTIAIVTDKMNTLSLKIRLTTQSDVARTHNEPIRAVLYNRNFSQIITCSDASIIKLWDMNSGEAISEFSSAHGNSPVTCMTLDDTGRRLITGGRDGYVRVWNHNNGRCLKSLTKVREKREICSVAYVEVNKNRYIVAVGWDRRVSLYVDGGDDMRDMQYPLPSWSDDLCFGHSEDILSVTMCPPNLLATSSYNGEVIIWNMVSGHIFCRLIDEENSSRNVRARTAVGGTSARTVSAVGGITARKMAAMGGANFRAMSAVGGTNAREKSAVTAALSGFAGRSRTTAGAADKTSRQAQSSHCGSSKFSTDQDDVRDMSICCVIFLSTRTCITDSACLVCSGPQGLIHFWSIYGGGRVMARVCPPQNESVTLSGTGGATGRSTVTTLAANKLETLLLSADNTGFICVWDIRDYCVNRSHSNNPPRFIVGVVLYRWRGHTEPVTCLVLIEEAWCEYEGEESLILVTSSLDGSARLWTHHGHYIGVLGQKTNWNLSNSTTYQHPMVPFDVLVDPSSLPVLPEDDHESDFHSQHDSQSTNHNPEMNEKCAVELKHNNTSGSSLVKQINQSERRDDVMLEEKEETAVTEQIFSSVPDNESVLKSDSRVEGNATNDVSCKPNDAVDEMSCSIETTNVHSECEGIEPVRELKTKSINAETMTRKLESNHFNQFKENILPSNNLANNNRVSTNLAKSSFDKNNLAISNAAESSLDISNLAIISLAKSSLASSDEKYDTKDRFSDVEINCSTSKIVEKETDDSTVEVVSMKSEGSEDVTASKQTNDVSDGLDSNTVCKEYENLSGKSKKNILNSTSVSLMKSQTNTDPPELVEPFATAQPGKYRRVLPAIRPDQHSMTRRAASAIVNRRNSDDQYDVSGTRKMNRNLQNQNITLILHDQRFRIASGKRLRHERCKQVTINHGGPVEYHSLPCYDLERIQPVQPPICLQQSRDSMDLSVNIDSSTS